MFYAKLALTGIGKNLRPYLPYIAACSGMAVMLYILIFLSLNPAIYTWTGETTTIVLQLGACVIAIFSVIFLFYTNSFLMKRRKREFGLYNILGMGKREIARVLIWETLIVYAVSMLIGIGTGALFSKLSELVLVNMVSGAVDYEFRVSVEGIAATLIVFALIFTLMLLNSLRQIHFQKPVELLSSHSVGEKPPKANFVAAVLGIVILAAAYYTAVSIKNPMLALIAFFFAVLMVIIATYMLFIAGSVAACRLLQKDKNYYYKTNHFLPVSQMTYRMRRNGAGLASICILSTMFLVTFSTTACLYFGTDSMIKREFPRNFIVTIITTESEQYDKAVELINETLDEVGSPPENVLTYRNYLEFAGVIDGGRGNSISLVPKSFDIDYDLRTLIAMPVSEYNRIMGENVILSDDEIVIYSNIDYDYDTFELNGEKTFEVKKRAESFLEVGNEVRSSVPRIYLFVKDEAALGEVDDIQMNAYKYSYATRRNFYCFDTEFPDEQKETIRQAILRRSADDILHKTIDGVDMEGVRIYPSHDYYERKTYYSLFGGLFFLGVLLGTVFLCAAVMIMHYKQSTEGYDDREKFAILKQVGMTEREIRASVNSQVLTVFFLPLIAAGIHTAFAFPMMSKMLALFGMTDSGLFAVVCLLCFGIFTVIYIAAYIVTSKSYYRIVNVGTADGRAGEAR